jgi:hypothetical protein
VLSESDLEQLQQVFSQTREEVSHFLLTGEQHENSYNPYSSGDDRMSQ